MLQPILAQLLEDVEIVALAMFDSVLAQYPDRTVAVHDLAADHAFIGAHDVVDDLEQSERQQRVIEDMDEIEAGDAAARRLFGKIDPDGADPGDNAQKGLRSW